VKRVSLWYAVLLVIFALGLFGAIEQGRKLEPPPANSRESADSDLGASAESALEPSPSLFASLRENVQDPLARLFIQLILIIFVARVCGAVARRLAQPAVIGEMIAGILLGPSLFGWLSPGLSQLVFPASSLSTLRLLSQIGVCLFMFVIGMELDPKLLAQQARTAVLVSQVSILFPYLLGVVSALFLFSSLAGPGTTFLAFALFMGISMSITAFPVLARILEERHLTRTALGATAIACAATDDVTAWTVLALVVAIAKANTVGPTLLTIGLVLLFVLVMFFWVKPRLPRWLGTRVPSQAAPGRGAAAGVIVFVFACALATELVGIHALFGAFLAGVIMPREQDFRDHFRVFLLPLFFAFTGLRTQVGLLNQPSACLICGALILVATVGKLGGAMIAARMTGINWIDSFSLGALMNTRGLVELIALNIGYDLGILSPRVFTMLVVMALVTTGMTGPLLSWAEFLRLRTRLAAKLA
jgi:Kef-type K+ transport system membrane component KefB